MFSSLTKKIYQSKEFVVFIILIATICTFLINKQGGDAVFPIIGGKFIFLENDYKFLWHQSLLGTVGILDKIRGLLAYLLSSIGLFNINIFLTVVCSIGFISFQFLLQTIFGKDDYKYLKIRYMVLSLFFVFNPLTIHHFAHYFLVQGYCLYPLILAFYIRYLRDTKYLNIYLLFFPILILFLGQPHNYYNAFVIIFLSFTLFGYKAFVDKKLVSFVKKHLVLTIYTSIFLIPIIGSFIASLPNDLTSSTSSFSGSEPNMIWSASQGIINTIVFKIDFFTDHLILLIIFLTINSLLLISLFFSYQKLQYKKYFIALFMIIMSLTFITKNPFFSSSSIRQIVYKFIPHLRIDVAYIELIFIFVFLLGVGYMLHSNKSKKSINILTVGLIIQILISIVLGYSFFRKNENIIDKSSFLEFTTWINETIKTHDPVLIQPLGVTYLVPGVSQSIYPVLFVENNPVLHWLFLEGTLSDTLKFVNKNKYLLNTEFLEKTSIRYIFCFPEGCKDINNNQNFRLLGTYQVYSIYEYVGYNSKFVTENVQYAMHNPTQYHLTTTFKSRQDLKFLQSFHPEWKIYLEPYTPLDCGSGATVYSGTTMDSGTGAKPLLTSPYQGRDGTIDATSTGIYLSQRGDTLASIARSQTGMTLTGIIALNPGITREVLRRGTEIVVSTSEQNPPNPISQGGTGATEQTGTGELYHVTECPSQNTFYAGGELAKLWEKPIFDDTHTMVYDYANQWTIDPAYIRANYPREYYRENPDGTIDVRMTMYFRPQSYFYLGLIISGLTLFGCVSYLVVSGVRGRRRRGEHRDKKVDLSREEI